MYLCSRIAVECGGRVLSDGELGGRQGRLLLAFLGTRRAHPVSRSQLTEGLWDSNTPRSVDGALNALISKLRSAMRRLGVPPPHGVATDAGAYQLAMPSAWIDIESARQSLDRAEGALRAGDMGFALAWQAPTWPPPLLASRF